MSAQSSFRGIRRIGAVAALAILALGSAPEWANAAPATEKMVRQIGVMEKIIDKVLIDSPNFLVGGGDNARGLYVDEFGVIFSFDASLVNEMFSLKDYVTNLSDRFEVKTDEDGNQIVVIKRGKEQAEKDKQWAEKDKEKAEEAKAKAEAKLKATSDESTSREKLYEGGKQELVDVLLDYGETMTALSDGKWIMIAAFLKNSDFFVERKISRLLLKAKIEDLRAFGAGRLSENDMKNRVLVEEY